MPLVLLGNRLVVSRELVAAGGSLLPAGLLAEGSFLVTLQRQRARRPTLARSATLVGLRYVPLHPATAIDARIQLSPTPILLE